MLDLVRIKIAYQGRIFQSFFVTITVDNIIEHLFMDNLMIEINGTKMNTPGDASPVRHDKGLLSPYTSQASFNTGSTIPLKWQYLDAAGNVMNSANATPEVVITDSTGAPITVTTPGNSGLQYDPLTMTWQLNWQTKGLAAGTYSVSIVSHQTAQNNGPFQVTLAPQGTSSNSNGKGKSK